VAFAFVGKSGKPVERLVTDARVVTIVRHLSERNGDALFAYLDDAGEERPVLGRAVNAYLKKTMGDEFSAKDFRTWGGTVRAMEAFLTADTDSDGLTIDQVHRDAVKAVAKNLGNTPAVAKSAYIDPRLFQRCQALDRVLDLQVAYRRLRDRTYFSRAEQ